VLVWAMAGCSGVPTNDGDDDSGSASSAGSGNAPGAPNRNHGSSGGGGAAGAPIKIPSRFDDEGRPLAEVTAEIESGLRDACGGELCVTLRTEQRDAGSLTTCQFYKTEPPQESFVKRGGTVTILSGSLPCEDTPEPEEPEDSPSSSGPTP
jgi:hypothetical protein